MMVQHIGDEFVRSQHTISIKAGLARQMLPLRKLNVPNMEWSVCGSFERGETSIGLILDYCNNQNQGTWAGLHCEFMNRNGTMACRQTKMCFLRPQETMYLKVRLFPEGHYKRRLLSTGRENVPPGNIFIRITTTLFCGTSKSRLETILARNNSILQTVAWPAVSDRVLPKEPDFSIVFPDGKQYRLNKAVTLRKLGPQSPLHQWHTDFPDSKVFEAAISIPLQEKSQLFFYDFIVTSYIQWKRFEYDMLFELLYIAKYFNYGALIRLCGVQLIHMLRNRIATVIDMMRIGQLELPLIQNIHVCHQVTTRVLPEVGNASEMVNDEEE